MFGPEQHVCDAEHECYESDTGCYPAHCRLCVQHDADLREIADKCLMLGRNSTPQEYANLEVSAIVREFREKQQKSKEGDARESGSSS